MGSCNLSVLRGTQSSECIEYTTFGFRLNPLKTLEVLAFLAAPACRATEMPAEALVSRAKSYDYQKTFKNLGKTCFPPLRLGACQKKLRRKRRRSLSVWWEETKYMT